jgi:hypothetical protein
MDLDTFRFMIQPFVNFFGPLIIGSFGTSAVVQFLKARQIPIPATEYPRITNLALSFVGAGVAIFISPANLVLATWWQWAAFSLGWFLLSAFWYNNVFRGTKSSKRFSNH